EDVFAVGMAFRVKRHRADDLAAGPGHGQVLRGPAGAPRCRAAFLADGEESVRHGRVEVAGAGIPLLAWDIGDRLVNLNRDRVAHQSATSNIASISTATPPGRADTPTAVR